MQSKIRVLYGGEIKMNESLLALLKKEDGLVRDVRLNKETYEMLKDKNKHLASEYMGKLEESKELLLECRKEISQYLDFLEVLKES